MFYSIDRFEDSFKSDSKIAVLIDDEENTVQVEANQLPDGAKENDVLIYENGQYSICEDESERRRKYIRKLQDSLWEN